VTRTAGVATASAAPTLYTGAFLAVCLVGLLGFAANFVIQPVLPLLVLERGGDATMVGIVIGAFSLPSVVLRPVMGRLADSAGSRIVLAAGLAVLALAGFAYLVPLLVVVLAVRIVHGVGWAAFNTGGHSLVARLAPPARRGEASGIYNLMPGLAAMAFPSLGLLLYASGGLTPAFVVSGVLGAAALGVVFAGRIPRGASAQPAAAVRGRDAWLEPGARLAMGYEVLFTLAYSLFTTFPPVFAAAKGIPVADLALYYPIYGGTLVVVRALAGRFLDRAPREPVIAAGASIAIVGLAVSAVAETIAVLTLGAALYAVAASFTSPTTMALAIDRADPRRMGAAMATYSLGFQLAIGAGAALWGVVIDAFGDPAPYLGAIAVQALLVGLVLVRRGGGPGAHRSTQEAPPHA
jgi:MFS family permease